MKIKLLHLYYDILNLYGEYGNVVVLKKHLEDQGYEVIVDKKSIGDYIDFSKYSFIYMGCGTERNLDTVLKDIKQYKKDIQKAIDNEVIFLLTGNSFEMLGKKIDDEDGLGIFDYETKRKKERLTSDVIFQSKYLKNKVVGFINMMTEMRRNTIPLFNKVDFGIGENNENKQEGIKFKNVYGTHISGPILARNPELLKQLVVLICEKVDKKFQYKEIEYEYEEKSYKMALRELEKR